MARWKSGYRLVGSLAFVLFAIYLFQLAPEAYPRRMPPEFFVKTIAVAVGVYFAINGAVAFANLVDPSRLMLVSTGFHIEGPSARKLVGWSEVDEFFISEIKLSKLIHYRLHTGAVCNLPTWYHEDPDLVVGALNRWLKMYRDVHSGPLRTSP